jgi:hypothetical protein
VAWSATPIFDIGDVFGSNGVTTSPVDSTGANFIIICAPWYSGSTLTISDSYFNTWTKLNQYGSGDPENAFYISANPTVGTGHTFTASGGAIYSPIAVIGFSGGASSPLVRWRLPI